MLPSECSRIVIVGAGGFAREVRQWACQAWPRHEQRIGGFLSADPGILRTHSCELPILGDPATFEPARDDGLILAIGIPGVRRRVAESLVSRGGRFLSLVHGTALVAPTACVGPGAVVCPYAIVSDAARVRTFGLVNYHASLAHDSTLGDFAVLSPYAALGGGASVGEEAFVGLHGSLAPGVSVGPRSKVAANSCALADVPPDCLVLGVPGRITPLVSSA